MRQLLMSMTVLLLVACTPKPPPTYTQKASYQKVSSQKAKLQLDTKGHTALIRDIIVTQSGDILSASEDKTIRVWDSKTGKEKRKILGQIGAGNEGKIFAIALSPSEEFLAVGGYFKSDDIRIYNYQSGKLLKVLKSHTNIIDDLAFSSDGKYLISGSGDFTAKIWHSGDFALVDTIKAHTNDVYAVKIIKNHNRYFAITAGYDNQIALYDMQSHKVVKRDRKKYKLKYLAISKEHIAVCGKGREIQIYDHALNPIKTIISETKPEGLAYSPNGEFLIAGTGNYPFNVNIYSVKENYKKSSSFKKHTNSTIAVAFLDKQTAVSAGGENNEIYIWDSKSASVKRKIEGVGATVWSVGVRGDRLAWGNVDDCRGKNCSKLQKSLNLKTFDMHTKIDGGRFKRMVETRHALSLRHRAGGSYGKSDAVLDIKQNGKTLASITRDATNGYKHRCYGFYKNYIVSGGSGGFLKIYNQEGREIANLVGHTGEVWSIALDGNRLVSGSDDQTIRVWDLSKLKQQMQPQLSLFISKENEWVAWTPEGFFDYSGEGATNYIGYHINQGANKEAAFVSVESLSKPFYKPSLVQKSLRGKDLSRYAKKINIEKILKDGLAPNISIAPLPKEVEADSVELNLSIEPRTGGVGEVRIYRHNMLISQTFKGVTGLKPSFKVGLEEGENRFKVLVFNKKNNIESTAKFVTVNAKTSKVNERPNLYVLSVGIDKFKNKGLSLKYAKDDAKHLVEVLKKYSEGDVFKKVIDKTLTTEKETSKASILKAIEALKKEVKTRDYILFNFSSHAEVVSGRDYIDRYFLLTSGTNKLDAKNLEKTAISASELTKLIGDVDARHKILVLDTCYSGAVYKKMMQNNYKSAIADDNMKKLKKAIGSSFFASSQSDEKSTEGYKGHGVFTYFLTKGLEGEADDNNDAKVNITELKDYTEDKVDEKKGQMPFIRVDSGNFPISTHSK